MPAYDGSIDLRYAKADTARHRGPGLARDWRYGLAEAEGDCVGSVGSGSGSGSS